MASPFSRTIPGGGHAVVISPDGRCAVAKRGDHDLTVWELDTRRKLAERRIPAALETAASLTITPDGKHVVSAHRSGHLGIWNIGNLELERTIAAHAPGAAVTVAVTSDGERIVSGGMTLGLWDFRTGEALCGLLPHNGYIEALAVSPDGCRAVSGGEVGQVTVWDLEKGCAVRELNLLDPILKRDQVRPWGPYLRVWGVTFLSGGRRIVAGGQDNTLWIWDAENGDLLDSRAGHGG